MVREILVWPDPILKQQAAPVAVVDDGVRALVKDMFETMYEAPGIGLAAGTLYSATKLLGKVLYEAVGETAELGVGSQIDAATGVDFVSVGGLTHSSPIVDLALDLDD